MSFNASVTVPLRGRIRETSAVSQSYKRGGACYECRRQCLGQHWKWARLLLGRGWSSGAQTEGLWQDQGGGLLVGWSAEFNGGASPVWTGPNSLGWVQAKAGAGLNHYSIQQLLCIPTTLVISPFYTMYTHTGGYFSSCFKYISSLEYIFCCNVS